MLLLFVVVEVVFVVFVVVVVVEIKSNQCFQAIVDGR